MMRRGGVAHEVRNPAPDLEQEERMEQGHQVERGLGGWAWGVIAAAAFVTAAVAATVVAFVYGSLLGITPEFPMVLSLQFLVALFLVALVVPLAGALTAQALRGQPVRRRPVRGQPGTLIGPVVAGIVGAATMTLVWEITSGPGADPLDWPHSLHLLQLAASGAVSGLILGAGIAGFFGSGGSGGIRVASALGVLFLLILAAPFAPLWLARHDFQERAPGLAARYIQLPADTTFATQDESSGRDALQANLRYKVSAVNDGEGRTIAVDVIGERRRYDIDVKEIHGYIQIDSGSLPASIDWNDPIAIPATENAVLELARSFSRIPLEIISVRRDSSGLSFVIRGGGLEMIARQGGPVGDPSGVHYSISATPPCAE